MKRFILPVFAGLSLIFAIVMTLASRPVYPASTPPAPPPEAASSETVAAVGLAEPDTENIELSCAVSGMVTALYVKAGDNVHAGQKLFSIDDRELAADLAVRRAALNSANAQLDKLIAQPRPEELPPLEAKVEEAKAELADADVQVRLIEAVTDRRAIREEDLLRRHAGRDAAKARLAQAEKDLALTKAGAWAPDIAIARTQVEQTAATIKQDEINLDRMTMRAPINGVILQNKVRLGQFAQCGPLAQPLMIFGGRGALHVRADVDETDAWRVKSGASAVAHLRGNSQIKYSLSFVRFEPYVIPKKSLTGDSTERVDTRVLEVIYRVEGLQEKLFDGQQLDVYIDAPSKVQTGAHR